ncbi:MAG: glycosyltransferase [Chloroflexota bacterium]|nr:glycosyltransferase [Chloroflexota bacterium]MDQ5867981.1 glycosyltransferase [Chloroflexota bacterium]
MASANHKLMVLILPSWYPTERYPVGGVFIQEQARALTRRTDVEVGVLFVDRVSVKAWLHRPKLLKMSKEEGVPVYRLLMPSLRGVWPFLHSVWAVLACAGLRRQNVRPDILHAHVSVPAGFSGALIKLLWRVPLVITEHIGPFSQLMRNRRSAFATRLSMSRADTVVAVSAALRDQIMSYPRLRRQIDVIPNVVNVGEFPVKAETRQTCEPARLLFVGEMDTSIKGVDYLIGAVSILRKRGVEVTLDLVGDGRNRREYETQARRLRVADLCRYHGMLRHEEVVEMMHGYDVLVVPSLAETFGVVVVEAMAAGVPVVATRCGGPEEIVTPDLGVLVAKADSAALADGITDVLSRPGDFPPAHLRRVAEVRFGHETISARLVELYREVLGRSG